MCSNSYTLFTYNTMVEHNVMLSRSIKISTQHIRQTSNLQQNMF